MSKKRVRIVKFCDETGYTDKAVRRKIEDGVWVEGTHFLKAPDGTIHIDMDEYHKWLEQGSQKA